MKAVWPVPGPGPVAAVQRPLAGVLDDPVASYDPSMRNFAEMLLRHGTLLHGDDKSMQVLVDVESLLEDGALSGLAASVSKVQDMLPSQKRSCELSELPLREVQRLVAGLDVVGMIESDEKPRMYRYLLDTLCQYAFYHLGEAWTLGQGYSRARQMPSKLTAGSGRRRADAAVVTEPSSRPALTLPCMRRAPAC